MENNNQQNNFNRDSAEAPAPVTPKEKKALMQMIVITLFLVGLLALIITCFCIFCKGTPKKDLGKTAVEALMLRSDNPATVTVLEVSTTDSIYENRYCSEKEIIEMSQKFLQYSIQLMSSDSRGDYNDPAFISMTERYSAEAENIDRLNTMLANPKGKFCGYKVGIKYKAIDKREIPFTTEAWFIFDKNQEHIIDYLELPLL